MKKTIVIIIAALLVFSHVSCTALPSSRGQTATLTRTATFMPSALATETQMYTHTPTFTPFPKNTSTSSPTATKSSEPFDYTTLPGRLAFLDFTCNHQNLCTNISVIKADLSEEPQLITDNDHAMSINPIWSPKGRYIAYDYFSLGENGKEQIRVYDFKTKQNIVLTPQGINGVFGMSWSPDERFLVFGTQTADGQNTNIFRINVQAVAMINLTSRYPGRNEYPAVSPDGKTIAFMSDRGEKGKSTMNVWVMNLDGSQPQNITPNDGLGWQDTKPSWDHSGQSITFYRYKELEGNNDLGGPGGLWIYSMDTKETDLLYAFHSDPEFSEPAVWSPDGHMIAFNFGKEKDISIWVVRNDGQRPVKIGQPEGTNHRISWSPDSRAFVFTNRKDVLSNIYISVLDSPNPFTASGPSAITDANWSPGD